MPDLDYLGHLARESARFASVLDATAADAPVPSCPGWTADDLLWHLGEVQWFWGTIVRDGVDDKAAQAMKPPRPASRPGLTEFYLSASRELGAALALLPPQTPAWTWADDKTAGFIRRRQAHEALIHRVDAELTANSRSALDPQLSADGVDEALMIMYGGAAPTWGVFTADEEGSEAGNEPAALRILAADTGDSWFITLGRFTGTDPEDEKRYDERAIQVVREDAGPEAGANTEATADANTEATADANTEAAASATIRGQAGDLDCWLWHRPSLAPVERSGSSAVLRAFEAIIAEGVN
jgi:uncharacterized protein (TIGR03083 family)